MSGLLLAAASESPPRPAALSGSRWWANPWLRFTVRRLVRLLVSVLALVSAAFAMIHAVPGDPVRAALGLTAPQSLVTARRHALGLDQPLWHQCLHFLHGAATGDLGTSTTSQLPVTTIIAQRLPPTAELAGLAFVVVLLIGIPLGMCAAALTREGRHPRTELGFGALTGLFAAIPEFLLGVGLVFAFAVTLNLLPVAGRAGPTSYLAPVAALAAGPIAILARIVRVEALRVLGQDYIRTARAKRLPARLLYVRHTLPNLLTATLTLSGLLLAGLLAGTVLVENVFAWPGLGTELAVSVPAKDYPVVQGLALVFGGGVLLINLVVDVLIAVADPRSAIRDT
ncbi:MAG: ABC transporter permease [Mycobacteriales bacterium]